MLTLLLESLFFVQTFCYEKEGFPQIINTFEIEDTEIIDNSGVLIFNTTPTFLNGQSSGKHEFDSYSSLKLILSKEDEVFI